MTSPVSVDVGGTEGVAVVQEGGVHQGVVLGVFHQVLEVAEVSLAAPHTVAGTVLVQNKHLTWAEPALWTQNKSCVTLFLQHKTCCRLGPLC